MMQNARLTLTLAAAALMAAGARADGNITGSVVNKNTSEPLGFATVTLVEPATGDLLPLGAAADADGLFVLRDVPSGRYLMRVSILGNVTQEREVTVADADIDVGRIELAEDSELLQEVVVTGQKSQMSVSAEKRVYNVSSNIASSGTSADELLASVPSVNVGSDGEISLRGNADVMVWIDGKAMAMNADNRAQILRQIPAENVESIEVMTNPSSRHSTEGTAGIINIRLKEHRSAGYFGSAEASLDTHGSTAANFSFNHNGGRFESVAALGLKWQHTPGGSSSLRSYDDGFSLSSHSKSRRHGNSVFLRLGTSYRPDDANTIYLSAIGTLGHDWGTVSSTHKADLPGQWSGNSNLSHEGGDSRGANILLGYRHLFDADSHIDMNVSYNYWRGSNDSRFHEVETWPDGSQQSLWQSQHQNMKISNWEAALDYSRRLCPWLRLEAGYKGNYNHEDSPASYSSGPSADIQHPLPELYNRFRYSTDISAAYVNFSGAHGPLTYSAGLRAEMWHISTRSSGAEANEADRFKRNDFALFPSVSFGWEPGRGSELKLNYSRRIHRPYGPQLNTFENISDPSEVHLGNPLILPEYSNAVELTYIRNWSGHMLSASAFLRSNTDMISHVSFLAPMASDPDVNTMYYGHANVGNMLNAGLELIARNTLFRVLTLTTTVNLYNSHLRAWQAEYPLHDDFYSVSGSKQNRLVWDARCMASVRLPWEMSLQATGRYNSRRITAQGTLESDWDVEAGIRKNAGAWSISLLCKDIFNSKESKNILYGNGYTQTVAKWSTGRTLRLSVAYTFGKSSSHDHSRENHIDTGGYRDEHHHH